MPQGDGKAGGMIYGSIIMATLLFVLMGVAAIAKGR